MLTQDAAIQFVAILGVLGAGYLFLVRPQLRRLAAHRKLLIDLRPGDRIVTAGGMIGTIVRFQDENTAEVELSKTATVQIVRGSIESKLTA